LRRWPPSAAIGWRPDGCGGRSSTECPGDRKAIAKLESLNRVRSALRRRIAITSVSYHIDTTEPVLRNIGQHPSLVAILPSRLAAHFRKYPR
jgi:hypothetical protein